MQESFGKDAHLIDIAIWARLQKYLRPAAGHTHRL